MLKTRGEHHVKVPKNWGPIREYWWVEFTRQVLLTSTAASALWVGLCLPLVSHICWFIVAGLRGFAASVEPRAH